MDSIFRRRGMTPWNPEQHWACVERLALARKGSESGFPRGEDLSAWQEDLIKEG